MNHGRWALVVALVVVSAGAAGCSAKRPTGSGATAGTGAGSAGSGAGAGSAGTGSTATASNNCANAGDTQTCCGQGTQTCTGTGEFHEWGPCITPAGKTITCSAPSTCAAGEFGPNCPAGTAGVGSSHVCGAGEFGPNCTPAADAGVPPHICGPGEFGPTCAKLPSLCTNPAINNEAKILVGYSPAAGQSVGANGQIKVWVNDECPEIIAPNEQIDANTGVITAPGDRTAKAADGYLWEPALYIVPQTAESGGTPHFPVAIKGWHNSSTTTVSGNTCRQGQSVSGVEVPGMDAAPAGANLAEHYNTEVIWDVSSLGLSPGTYIAEFVIHDGDKDRAVGCVTITITN